MDFNVYTIYSVILFTWIDASHIFKNAGHFYLKNMISQHFMKCALYGELSPIFVDVFGTFF